LTSRTIAKKIAGFTLEKKAEDIVVLDMRGVVNFCDYFVICTGQNDRQVRAIADSVEEGLARSGLRLSPKKGAKDSGWIVFDAGDVVTHIFNKDARAFYNLEHLWQDAKEVKWSGSSRTAPKI
jgi:ribosome-associated protein